MTVYIEISWETRENADSWASPLSLPILIHLFWNGGKESALEQVLKVFFTWLVQDPLIMEGSEQTGCQLSLTTRKYDVASEQHIVQLLEDVCVGVK